MKIVKNLKKKNSMGIKFNGISTPFGGVSWEYTEVKNQEEYEAIQLLFIFLEGKRLITLPYSRNNKIDIVKDKEWCSLSVINLKGEIFSIISKYTLPLELINELQSMINHCNSLLEGIESLNLHKITINDISENRDEFLELIDNFKQSIFPHIKSLSKKYSIEFKEIENDII